MLGTVCGTNGSVVTVPVTVGNTTGENIISYDFQVTYDPTIVQPVGGAACTGNTCIDVAGTLSSTMLMTPNTANSGHFIVSAFQANAISGAGTLINLKFNVIGTIGQSTTLIFEDYTDPQGNPHTGFQFNEGTPIAATLNGAICVSATAASVAGRVLTNGGQGIQRVPVVLYSNSLVSPIMTRTGTFGSFAFEGLTPGETYVVTVNSSRYTFSPPSRVVSLTGDSANMEFIADPLE